MRPFPLLALLLAPAAFAAEEFSAGGVDFSGVRGAGFGKAPAVQGQGQGPQAAPAPRPAAAAPDPRAFTPRSEVAAYVRLMDSPRRFYPFSYYKAPADDANKLFDDLSFAIDAYERLKGRRVSYEDRQQHMSVDFYMSQGAAVFNPNRAQTAALKGKLDGYRSSGKFLQVDALYEAIVAADGNVTLALGSLAELYCHNRDTYIAATTDVSNSDGKNYYRYAGGFIGLHATVTRALGESAAYANIVGNPVVYAGAEIVQWWGDFLRGRPTRDVNTLRTLGPQGNGNVADKGGELRKGMDAAQRLRTARGLRL